MFFFRSVNIIWLSNWGLEVDLGIFMPLLKLGILTIVKVKFEKLKISNSCTNIYMNRNSFL